MSRVIRPDPTPEELAQMPHNLRHYYRTRHELREKRRLYAVEYNKKILQDPTRVALARQQKRVSSRKMREQDPEKYRAINRAHLAKWRAEHYDEYRAQAATSREISITRKKRLMDVFRSGGCASCREMAAITLDCHHYDMELKEFTLGRHLSSTMSPVVFANELAKCVCLCATCHRKVHGELIPCPKPTFNAVSALTAIDIPSNPLPNG